MSLKKIKKAIHKELANQFEAGWSSGYDAATEICEQLREVSFVEGANKEQERIQEVIRMNIQWATESGRGSEVIFWNKAKEILIPINIDYSEETYKRQLEEDGF
jgi:hypothetical protein